MMEDFIPTPKFMGLPITDSFAKALGMAQEKHGKAQMTHATVEPSPEAPRAPPEAIVPVATPIQELEAKVQEELKQMDNTGYKMLPGAAGKRDSDVQPSVIEKMIKKHPELIKSNPSAIEKYEIYLRRVKKLSEEEVDDIMSPLWSTYLHSDSPFDELKKATYRNKPKST